MNLLLDCECRRHTGLPWPSFALSFPHLPLPLALLWLYYPLQDLSRRCNDTITAPSILLSPQKWKQNTLYWANLPPIRSTVNTSLLDLLNTAGGLRIEHRNYQCSYHVLMPETTFPLLVIQGTADMVARVKYVLGPSLVLVMAEPRASRPGVDGRIQISADRLARAYFKALWGKARSCIADTYVGTTNLTCMGLQLFPTRVRVAQAVRSLPRDFHLFRYLDLFVLVSSELPKRNHLCQPSFCTS